MNSRAALQSEHFPQGIGAGLDEAIEGDGEFRVFHGEEHSGGELLGNEVLQVRGQTFQGCGGENGARIGAEEIGGILHTAEGRARLLGAMWDLCNGVTSTGGAN